MKKAIAIILLLIVALVATNIWWAYQTLDIGTSLTYQSMALEEHQKALTQTLAVLKAASQPNSTKIQIIAAAQNLSPSSEPFEKEGYLWVGWIGLRFDQNDHLVEVTPAWSYEVESDTSAAQLRASPVAADASPSER